MTYGLEKTLCYALIVSGSESSESVSDDDQNASVGDDVQSTDLDSRIWN